MSTSLAFNPNFIVGKSTDQTYRRKYSDYNRQKYPFNMSQRDNQEFINNPNNAFFDKNSNLSMKSPSIMSNRDSRLSKSNRVGPMIPNYPVENAYSRQNSITSGYINDNPDINPGLIPPTSQAQQKPASGFSKFIQSMRRGKSQSNINQIGMDNLNQSQSNLRANTLNKSSRFKFLGGSKSELNVSNFNIDIIHLDGQKQGLKIDKSNCTGIQLFNSACEHANILEVDYFGLTFQSKSSNIWFWLENDKKISKQLGNSDAWVFFFQVKFYPPEPSLLLEDITRFNLVLQLRQDISSGKLPCSWVTQALLGSYLLQSEMGNYDEKNPISIDRLKIFHFVRNPSDNLLIKILELHKAHGGMKPAQADLKYLETAKRLERYGIDLHPARDMEDIQIHIGVSHQGIVIYRDGRRIGRFAWPKVLQLSYEKTNFFLTIRPDNIDSVETKIGFRLYNSALAKRLWTSAVDHHSFFRLKQPQPANKKLSLGRSFGSQHQLSCRTFYQNRTMTINRPNPNFDRTLMKKKTASMPMGLNNMDNQFPGSRSVAAGLNNPVENVDQNGSLMDESRMRNDRMNNYGISRGKNYPRNEFASPEYVNYGNEDGSYIGGGSMISGFTNSSGEKRRNNFNLESNPNGYVNDRTPIRRNDQPYVNNRRNYQKPALRRPLNQTEPDNYKTFDDDYL